MPILPIDTGRYGSPEMRLIFEEQSRLQKWLDVESAVARAQAELGIIPKEAAEEIAKKANTKFVTVERCKEIERENSHDLMAMVLALTEKLPPEAGRYVHFGLTSYDVEDTATALQFRGAFNILESKMDQLRSVLRSLVKDNQATLMPGRTHGQQAGVITLGLKFAVWLEEVHRHLQRLDQVRERALVGKVLGLVGTGAALGKNALQVQEKALEILDLTPAGVVTQIIQRDIHAEVVCYLAILASSLDKFATEVRNLQRTEIGELMEPFDRDRQVGSSAMPAKRNPMLSERVSSLAKLMRGLAIPALENIPQWHERDLTNSANERFVFPMTFILADEMLNTTIRVLKGLEVNPENMRRNLELSGGLILAENIVNKLVHAGAPRQEAHERVRKLSMRAIDDREPFSNVLKSDKFVSQLLKPSEIEDALDYRKYLGVADQLITKALKEN
jgi:adenylosuccinate lyase